MSTKNERDYKELNNEEIKKYFEDSKIEYIPNKKISEKQFNENISKILKPNINIKNNSNINISEEKYIPKVSDPYKRLLNIKSKLIQNKLNIDNIISKYNDINSKVDLNDINNYSLFFSNLHKYKSKIDSFINYDIIKKNQNKLNESDSSCEESEDDEQKKTEKKHENQIKNMENKKIILKKREENEKLLKQIEESPNTLFRDNTEINSLGEKYTSLSNNLISKLNNINEDMNTFLQIKILGTGYNFLSDFKKKIIDVENQVSKIEAIIGDYSFSKYKDTIFGTLKHFLKMNTDTNKDWISNRFENSRLIDKRLENFNSQPDNIKYLSMYKQICDGYMIYLTMEKFKDVISYLKKRLVAIKNIILNSEQFENDIQKLNVLIKENEEKYEILKFKYLQALESFDKLDNVLKEINNLDGLIKKKI